MTLRCGITTGTCAAAAAKAAAMVLVGSPAPAVVEVSMPAGEEGSVAFRSAKGCPFRGAKGDDLTVIDLPVLRVPIVYARRDSGNSATAAVRKDAGDDADVTHGLEILATVSRTDDGQTTLVAGEGVGIVTKPGLQVPPGQPAINPVPRQMILAAVRSVTPAAVRVEISIPGGREIAQRTFNPRLGIEGGLSILGTTGIVRPYCTKALHDALRCSLDVAEACGVSALVLVPGNIGAKAARRQFTLRDEQLIEAGNEWGFLLGELPRRAFRSLLLAGHPGKLAKLAEGQWDTHSSRSQQATHLVERLLGEVLGHAGPQSPTVEGIFAAIADAERTALGNELARRIARSVGEYLASPLHTVQQGATGVSPVPWGRLPICLVLDWLATSPTLGTGKMPVAPMVDPPGTGKMPVAPMVDPPGTGKMPVAPGQEPTRDSTGRRLSVAVLLVDMAGRRLGADGDFSPWQ
jgi:cobalt-precorrin-5B (C1)-methyltransferase